MTIDNDLDLIQRLDRAHRMSCSDPDDPTRETLYSMARDGLRAAAPVVHSVSVLCTADPDMDQTAAVSAVAAALDLLPYGSLVQAVTVSELYGREHRVNRYFEKHGSRWMALDPTDRDDGEYLFDLGYVVASSIGFGAPGREGGFIRVLFVGEA